MKRISLFSILVLLILLAFIGDQRLKTHTVEQPAPTAAPAIVPVKNLDERKAEGPVLMYYDNGQLKAERTYKDNKLNGIYRMYYDNGSLKVEGNYKDDMMDGIFRHYDRNGQLQIEETYRDNILTTRKVLNNN